MAYAPIKKSQAAKARPAPQPDPRPELYVQGLAGEAAAANDERAEALALVPVECRTPDDFIRQINNLWRQTKARFLLIGRYLIAAKERWPHGEYEKNIQVHLPFGPEVARQIKAVAEAVYLKHRLCEDELPSSYSIAYYLTTLTEPQLEEARSQQLVREDLKRREIIDFKKRHLQAERPNDAPGADVEGLLEEKRRLCARIAEIDRELQAAGVIEGELVSG